MHLPKLVAQPPQAGGTALISTHQATACLLGVSPCISAAMGRASDKAGGEAMSMGHHMRCLNVMRTAVRAPKASTF